MINRINCLFVIAGSVWFLGSCIEHRKDYKGPVSSTSVSREEEKYIKDEGYKVFRIYEGTIPCEDCDGIEQRLVVKGDTAGIFRLTETYKNANEDGDATLVCSGQWKQVAQKKRNVLVLSQGNLNDSVRRMEYDIHSNELFQRTLDNEVLKNSARYRLKLVRQSNPPH